MKKILSLFLLALVATDCFAHVFPFFTPENEYVKQDHHFGADFYKKHTAEGSHSIVEFPPGGLFSKHEHLTDFHQSLLTKHYNFDEFKETKNEGLISCSAEGRSEYFDMLPMFIGNLGPQNRTISYSAPCWQNSSMTLSFPDNETIQLDHTVSGRATFDCTDAYIFSTLTNYHIDTIMLPGTHTSKLKITPEELAQVNETGIFIFRMCDKTVNFIPDLIKTMWLFLGGLGLGPNVPFFGSKPTPEQIKSNIQFIKDATGYQWQTRPQDVVVDIDESLLNSGDFLAITRFDGLDQIIEYGSGGHVGHSVMVLKVNGEAFVVESQAAWYWPRKNIQINPYKQWVQWARDADFMVTWLPLKPEYAAKFNATAAYETFLKFEGLPYGYHNFIWGWVDTAEHSMPPVLAPEFLGAAFAILEKVSPSAADSVFTQAMNMRLGTVNLTIPQVAAEAAKRGLTMPDLYAMVEQDSWVYSDGPSRQCSGFVITMWIAGGLFDGVEINAAEFTPRDITELVFLDPNPPVPDNCKQVDPTNKFCQIMGAYRMEFETISTVSPYSHMNEICWCVGPDFARYPVNC